MNRNTLWAEIFVDELARNGLKAVCAAPGSRHTPLMLAFAKHPSITVYSHLDERSAGFFALGLAIASDQPTALICTSGSAAANFYPAIVEAHQSRVPLIVITADRPHELRGSGANQTMDQLKMFGDFALWFVDAPLPEAEPSALVTRHLRTLAGRAYAIANGIRKGVVHINMPFRKPLEPIPVETDRTTAPQHAEARLAGKPFTQFYPVQAPPPHPSAITEIADLIAHHENGVIICGGRLETDSIDAIIKLSESSGYPILAEAHSGARHLFGGYEFYLNHTSIPSADVVIRFGAVPSSNAITTYLAKSGQAGFIQISASGDWADDSHRTTHFIHASESVTCEALVSKIGTNRPKSRLWQALTHAEKLARTVMQAVDGDLSDALAVYDVLRLAPDNSVIFAGNSLAVRHVDQLAFPDDRHLQIVASRGVSGIDGNISTALGLGAHDLQKPLIAIVGDITFYHDMNGLLAIQRCGVPITIILLNNDGGGIFHRLPINQFDPEFTEWFITPHGLDLSQSAKLYGIDYVLAENREALQATFQRVVGKSSTIIEIRSDAKADLQARNQWMAQVREQLG